MPAGMSRRDEYKGRRSVYRCNVAGGEIKLRAVNQNQLPT
jgi:hypothetical protein